MTVPSIKNAVVAIFMALLVPAAVQAQPTFKTIWKTYNTGWVIHEYTFNYVHTDSVHLYLTDSAITYVSSDSLVSMTEYFRNRETAKYKTVNYLSAKKQLLKTEDYKDETLQEINEWRFDEKNRKSQHYKDNKVNGNSYKKQYEYTTDKKSGEAMTVESSYFNNQIEFYTKMYFNSRNQMIKEVRLNDNNKDIIHVETFVYGENGKVSQRSVYFPEFQVTKKFEESAGSIPAKCFEFAPAGIFEKPGLNNKVSYTRKVLLKNHAKIADPACKEFEFVFLNGSACAVTVASTKVNNGKIVKYRFREKVM